jgi:hypothetical protein
MGMNKIRIKMYKIHLSPALLIKQKLPVKYCSDSLTLCNTVIFSKLTVAQVVNKFPEFYGAQRFLDGFFTICPPFTAMVLKNSRHNLAQSRTLRLIL